MKVLKSEFTVLLRYVWNIVLKHCAIILILLFAFGFTEREILGFIYDKNTRSYSSASKISCYAQYQVTFIKFSNAQKYLKACIKLQVTKLS